MKLENKINEIAAQFENADIVFGQGTENAWDEAAWIALWVLGYDLAEDVTEDRISWHRSLSQGEITSIDDMVQQRIRTRQPFAYMVNESWFAGNRFYVDERTIVPRSYLAEWIPDAFSPWVNSENVRSVLDLCTGCGCIAISCALKFPEARVVASDVSDAALQVTRINIEKYQLTGRVETHQGDGFQGIDQRFDIIVCNPPYVSSERMEKLPEEYRKEPDQAFHGGEDGLEFILPLLQNAEKYLTKNGIMFVEAGSASHALEDKFPEVPFTWMSTEYDEMVVFCITVAELQQYGKLFDGGQAG